MPKEIIPLIIISIVLLINYILLSFYSKMCYLNEIVDFNKYHTIKIMYRKLELSNKLFSEIQQYACIKNKLGKKFNDATLNFLIGITSYDMKNLQKFNSELDSATMQVLKRYGNMPGLEDNYDFIELRNEFDEVNSTLRFAKHRYNNAVIKYNSALHTILGIIFAKVLNNKSCPYL